MPRSTHSTLAMAALLSGCQIASLPPASTRTDGGPVASRGTVSHEARSSVRFYVDAAGCESVQTVNRQFRMVTIARGAGAERLVLEEAYDVRHCLSSESASSEAAITAWRPNVDVTAPEYRISGRGATGEPVGNLYRMTNHGCCGSSDLATYYSLLNGQNLFTSSQSPRQLEVANTRSVRYAGFHDTFSAVAPPEAAADSTVIGVLQWGDDVAPARRIVVRADRPEAFATVEVRFVANGKPLADSSLVIWPDKPARQLALSVRLVSPNSNRLVTFEIPIVDLDLAVPRATLPAGIRLSSGG